MVIHFHAYVTTRLLFWNVVPTELNKRKPPYHHKGNQCQNKFWTWFFSFDLCFTQHALWPQDLYKVFFSVFRCRCHLNCHILFRAQRRSQPHFESNNMFFPFCYRKNSLHHRPTLPDIWFRHAPQLAERLCAQGTSEETIHSQIFANLVLTTPLADGLSDWKFTWEHVGPTCSACSNTCGTTPSAFLLFARTVLVRELWLWPYPAVRVNMEWQNWTKRESLYAKVK